MLKFSLSYTLIEVVNKLKMGILRVYLFCSIATKASTENRSIRQPLGVLKEAMRSPYSGNFWSKVIFLQFLCFGDHLVLLLIEFFWYSFERFQKSCMRFFSRLSFMGKSMIGANTEGNLLFVWSLIKIFSLFIQLGAKKTQKSLFQL